MQTHMSRIHTLRTRCTPPTLDGTLCYGTLDHLASNSSVISSLQVALELCRVEGFSAIRHVEYRDGCHLAVVALEACPAPGEIGLEGIRSLKRKGFRVICYEEDAQSWPLSKHCEVLLAGASLFLDSARREFGQDLQRHLAQLLQVEAGGQDDEARVKHVMRELGTVGESQAITGCFSDDSSCQSAQ